MSQTGDWKENYLFKGVLSEKQNFITQDPLISDIDMFKSNIKGASNCFHLSELKISLSATSI